MPGLFEIDTAFIIKNRFACIHFHGKSSSCKNKIKLDHDVQIKRNGFPFDSNLFAEICKDHFNFLLFLEFQFTHIVVQFDNRHWLNEKGRTSGRLIVDHTRNLTFIFSLNRHAVSAVSHSDHSILKITSGTTVYQSG